MSARSVSAWLRLPPARWQARIEAMGTNEQILTSDLAALACVRLARLSAYVSRRLSGGKHEDAVKAQNTAARKVRQALGYTYTNDQLTF